MSDTHEDHHLYRPLDLVEIRKVEGVERENAIRTYCYMSKTAWNLQLRAPLTLKNRSESKDFLIATATLGIEDVRVLRDQLTQYLKDAGEE